MASAGSDQDPEPALDLACQKPSDGRAPAGASFVRVEGFARAPKLALRRNVHLRVTTGEKDLGDASVEKMPRLNSRDQRDLVPAADEDRQESTATRIRDPLGHANTDGMSRRPCDDAAAEPNGRKRCAGAARANQMAGRADDLATKYTYMAVKVGPPSPRPLFRSNGKFGPSARRLVTRSRSWPPNRLPGFGSSRAGPCMSMGPVLTPLTLSWPVPGTQ